jgi:hypothetical protein
MKSKLQKVLRVLPWFVLLLISIYFFFGEGWKDVTLGRFHRKAQAMFSETENITEARIYLIMGTKEQQTKETFPIRPYRLEAPVCGSVSLTGEKLEAFLKLWQWQSPSYWRQALCHHPVYGFRLYRGTTLASETSICWKCHNYYVEVFPFVSSWYGFDSDSKVAKELLNYCDGLLPYARPEEETPKSKK